MDDSETIPVSALQHWLFCPRQCALIHVERLWTENRLTAEGRLLHQRADMPGQQTRGDLRTLRAVPLASARLGVSGIADVVEIRDGAPYPVEYKRGRPKSHRADEVQLCAQAICLEEMFGRQIPRGALYYGESRRRQVVEFDATLRDLTINIANEARAALAAGDVPRPIYDRKRCDACSLLEQCWPRQLSRPQNISAWLEAQVAVDGDDGP